jgi:hypothetical protein
MYNVVLFRNCHNETLFPPYNGYVLIKMEKILVAINEVKDNMLMNIKTGYNITEVKYTCMCPCAPVENPN